MLNHDLSFCKRAHFWSRFNSRHLLNTYSIHPLCLLFQVDLFLWNFILFKEMIHQTAGPRMLVLIMKSYLKYMSSTDQIFTQSNLEIHSWEIFNCETLIVCVLCYLHVFRFGQENHWLISGFDVEAIVFSFVTFLYLQAFDNLEYSHY